MRLMMVFIFIFFSGSSYSIDVYKSIDFKDSTLVIPARWSFSEKNDCLFIWEGKVRSVSYLRVCRDTSGGESDNFTLNDDGVWEAVTDGVPILADVVITKKYTGMSATVLCKYKDAAGYHTDECFQAEIVLPEDIYFKFSGVGKSSLFDDYKKLYLSFKIK